MHIRREGVLSKSKPLPLSSCGRAIPRLVNPEIYGVERYLVRRRIVLGRYRNPAGYMLAGAGRARVLPSALSIHTGTPIAKRRTELTVVFASVNDLGHHEGASTAEVHEAALKDDLKLCPAETGLALRYDYLEQPPNDWIAVAMAPIVGDHGPLIYCLGCNLLEDTDQNEHPDGRRTANRKQSGPISEWLLCGMPGGVDERWPPDFVFAFVHAG